MSSAPSPGPIVAYCIFHQSRGDLLSKDYVETIRSLHTRIADATGALHAGRQGAVREHASREAQRLYGALSQFLETPLRRDQEEIRRILTEGLGRFADSLTADAGGRFRSSNEGRIRFNGIRSAGLKRLVQVGKAYLEDFGFTPRGPGEIYESCYIVEGGAGLDLLEQAVRDQLGIYSAPHGTHIASAACWTFGAYNLVADIGDQALQGAATEVCLHLQKQSDVRYDDFRHVVLEAARSVVTDASAKAVTIWQRKLGLGRGKEFIIRGYSDNQAAAETAGEKILGQTDRVISRQKEAEPAVCLFKELLIC